MRVNIISNFGKNTGLNQDTFLLRGIIAGLYEKDVSISCVPHIHPHCQEADINFFLETINPSLFSYARKNILIPNLEWTNRNWAPYLNMVDEIWVKTREAEDVLKTVTTKPIKYIGWTSIDKVWDIDGKKNYFKAMVPVGKNIFRHPRPLFQAYMRILSTNPTLYTKLPILNVVYSSNHLDIVVPSEIIDKVNLKGEVLKESEYDQLLKECGLCICLSLTEGFGHAVNEAMSVGSNLILSSIRAFTEELVGEPQSGSIFCEILEKMEHPDCFGSLVDTKISGIVDSLTKFVEMGFKEKRAGSENIRKIYETRHKTWIETMKIALASVLDKDLPEYVLKDVFPKEEDLPDVSIITLTKDRRPFMALAKYCYLLQTYPEDKMEWVIVDDGEDSIEDTLIGIPNVTYVKCEPGMTIAAKRNLGVQKAMYDILIHADDDDVYPENTVLHRVAMMLKDPARECAFCTTIPCYDITKYSSFMNIPPMTLKMSERVSEATLIYTRKFWEENKFDESVKVGEGDAFIRGREQMCREVSPQEVIVSLIHPKNTSSRKLPEIKEPNGCHYGFNEKLYALVSEIGVKLVEDQLNSASQEVCGETCVRDASCESGDDDHHPPQVPQ